MAVLMETRGPSGVRGMRSHLADTLFINGTLYFLVFITLNTIQLAFTLISTIYALDTIGAVIVFTDPLQAIMVCRFMLALQSASGRDALGQDTTFDGRDDTNTTYGEQTLRFASLVVGSIGAQLETSDAGIEEALIQDWSSDAGADVKKRAKRPRGPQQPPMYSVCSIYEQANLTMTRGYLTSSSVPHAMKFGPNNDEFLL
ncbi:hypothetical protein VTO73DRAFT_11820 [Trametes versicolor]